MASFLSPVEIMNSSITSGSMDLQQNINTLIRLLVSSLKITYFIRFIHNHFTSFMNSCTEEILYFVSLLKICLIACASSLILPWQQQRNSYTEPRQYQNRYVNVNIFFYIQLRYKYGYKYLKVIKYQQVDVNDDCRNPLTVTRTTLDTCHVVIVHSCSITCIHVSCFLQSLSTQFFFTCMYHASLFISTPHVMYLLFLYMHV